MKRRQFLKRVAQTAAALSASSALSADRVAGANDRVRVGLIGCGGRGMLVARLMREVPDVEFAAVCDLNPPHLARAKEWAGASAKDYKDFRRLLEQKGLDAVLIATPDHWHAIPTVLACQAGKDVYVEKPLAHNIKEGRAMVAAARRHNRVVQMGTQQRSAPHYAEVARIIQGGALGPVHFVRIWNYTNMFPNGIGRAADSHPPDGVDWEMYLGPAPLVPYNKNRFINTYRWFWDYGGGLVTDFGIHRFDSLHQIMAADAPISVSAAGGRYGLMDGAETPDLVQVTYEYRGFILSYEACMLNAHGAGGRSPGKKYYQAHATDDRPHGEAYYGTNGTLIVDRLGFEVYPELNAVSGPGAAGRGDNSEGTRMERKEMSADDATGLHVKNFIECVRTRNRPAADVETGHRSTIVAHLGNIAFRSGRKIHWEFAKEDIVDDPESSKLLGRAARKPWDII
jgi:predicted dehydrogenase